MCCADDNNSPIVDESFVKRIFSTRGRRSILEDINFMYKRMRIKVVESFVHLGALFHWKQTAESAWADRENTAFKVFGAPFASFPSCRSLASKKLYIRRLGACISLELSSGRHSFLAPVGLQALASVGTSSLGSWGSAPRGWIDAGVG